LPLQAIFGALACMEPITAVLKIVGAYGVMSLVKARHNVRCAALDSLALCGRLLAEAAALAPGTVKMQEQLQEKYSRHQ
jgi:hypothetical protein